MQTTNSLTIEEKEENELLLKRLLLKLQSITSLIKEDITQNKLLLKYLVEGFIVEELHETQERCDPRKITEVMKDKQFVLFKEFIKEFAKESLYQKLKIIVINKIIKFIS